MDNKRLSPTTIFLAKSGKRGTKTRSGYQDEAKQVFLPPANAKRASAWKKKLEERGYSFS